MGFPCRTRRLQFALCVCAAFLVAALSVRALAQARRPYAASRYGGNYMHNYHFAPAPSSTPAAPEWSPDGRWIAVGMAGSIWRVDPANGAAEELTTGPRYHGAPTWSPDGRFIVYTADDGGKTIRLEVLDVQTGKSSALTDDGANYADPLFSPDGSQLVFTSSRPNGYFNVFVRAFKDGSWAGDEIALTSDSSFARDRPYFTNRDMHVTPSWDTNGASVLLLSNRNVALGSGNLMRVPVEPGGVEKASLVLEEHTLYQTRADMSPDGRQIVYSSARGGTQPYNQLYVMPADGGASRPLTRSDHDAFHPRWSPDGKRIAFLTNETGVPQLAILDPASDTHRLVRIRSRTWKRPAGRLLVRVHEAGSRRTTPARIHLTASDGKLYAPDDYLARLSWAGDRLFHTTGEFSLELPAGRVVLDVVKGFEFSPTHHDVEITEGRIAALDVTLNRIDDPASRGWFGGSTGLHIHGGGPLLNRLHALLSMSDAEGQRVINRPFAYREPSLARSDFWVRSGSPHRLSTKERLLILGQEHRPPFHGHIAMFGMKSILPSLIPVTIGYEGPTEATSLRPSNSVVLRKAHSEGAVTAYVHAFSGEADPITQGLGLGKAFMVDAALRTADALEWAAAGRSSFFPWYAALNNGLRITAIGGEDTIANLYISRLVGSVRTYAYTGNKGLDAEAWWDAVAKGRAFVTTGPLVELTVDGKRPGDAVKLPAAGRVEVVARVRSITPLQKVLLVFNGEIVDEVPLDARRTSVDWKKTLTVARSGWYHLRAEGSPAERYPLDALYAQAFTNPVWVTVADRPVRDRASAEYALKWIDMLQLMAETWPAWKAEDEKRQVFADFDEARQVWRRFLAEAPAPTAGGMK